MSVKLRLPVYKCLNVLRTHNGSRPMYYRIDLARKAGFKPGSGTINVVLHGIKKGSKYARPHKGALDLGLIEKVEVEVDGDRTETVYRIGLAGTEALHAYEHSETFSAKKARKVREASLCVNKRYKK
jgi:hypothetical protein